MFSWKAFSSLLGTKDPLRMQRALTLEHDIHQGLSFLLNCEFVHYDSSDAPPHPTHPTVSHSTFQKRAKRWFGFQPVGSNMAVYPWISLNSTEQKWTSCNRLPPLVNRFHTCYYMFHLDPASYILAHAYAHRKSRGSTGRKCNMAMGGLPNPAKTQRFHTLDPASYILAHAYADRKSRRSTGQKCNVTMGELPNPAKTQCFPTLDPASYILAHAYAHRKSRGSRAYGWVRDRDFGVRYGWSLPSCFSHVLGGENLPILQMIRNPMRISNSKQIPARTRTRTVFPHFQNCAGVAVLGDLVPYAFLNMTSIFCVCLFADHAAICFTKSSFFILAAAEYSASIKENFCKCFSLGWSSEPISHDLVCLAGRRILHL